MPVTRAMRLFLAALAVAALIGPGRAADQPLFKTGQKAEIVLGPYSSRAVRSEFNHPMKAFSDGRRLYVSDTRNNRILIWKSAPARNGQAPDLVLGQKSFATNASGGGRSGLNWPMGIYSDGKKLFVADAFNWRVLIWNKIPTANGAPADLVLGQPDFDTVGPGKPPDAETHLSEPWGVCYDGTKLLVAVSSRVLVWKKLPTRNNQKADLVLGQKNFTSFEFNDKRWNLWTPTCVDSDGRVVAVGDYNAKKICLWTKPLTKNGQPPDVVIKSDAFPDPVWVNKYRYHTFATDLGTLSIKNGKLLIGCNLIWIWDSIPTRDNQKYSRYAGADKYCAGGRYYGLQYDGRRIVFADGNTNRVLIYNGIPSNGLAPADIVLGAKDLTTNVFQSRRGGQSSGGLVSTGTKLAFSSFMGRTVIYQDLPKDNARPLDTILSIQRWNQWYAPWCGYAQVYDPFREQGGLWSDGLRLLVADWEAGVLLYDRFPDRDHQTPYRRLISVDDMQRLKIAQLTSACLAGNKLAIIDARNNQVMIWNALPDKFRLPNPDVTLRFGAGATHLASDCATDGRRLAVSLNDKVLLWNAVPTRNDQKPDLVLDRLNQPSGIVIHPNLFAIAELGNNRVLVYARFPASANQRGYAVLGQPNDVSTLAGKSSARFNMPARLSFDGEFLWVGEFKWGDRILGFRAALPKTRPAAPSGLRARAVSNNRIELSWTDAATNERGYRVDFRKAGSPAFEAYGYPRFDATSCSLDGLDKNTPYEFRVSAFNGSGTSPAATASARTLNKANAAQDAPIPLFPASASLNYEPQSFLLRWGGGDADAGDIVSYDLYFGTTPTPPLLAQNLTATEWFGVRQVIPSGTQFFWKIVSRDRSGVTTEGALWSFQTWGIGPWDKFTVTVSSAAGGTTNYAPGAYDFVDLEDADQREWLIQAYPDSGYAFAGWTGDVPAGHEKDNPLYLCIDRSRQLAPVFTAAAATVDRPPDARR